jgi:predicted PurR-regulated permease PerM
MNSLVVGWEYYLKEKDESADDDNVYFSLFVDGACEQYPVTYRREASGGEDAESSRLPMRMRGKLLVSRGTCLSWLLAFSLAVVCLGSAVLSLGYLMFMGTTNFTDNLKSYEKGVQDVVAKLAEIGGGFLSPEELQVLKDKIKASAQDSLPAMADSLRTLLQEQLANGLLFMIYFCFWLAEPLPVNKHISKLFKAYIMLKTFVCILFGALMGGLLYYLGNPLWPLIALVTALLNFIPEVGAVLSALFCVPVVLLNGQVDIDERLNQTLILVVFGSLFKVVCGNIIEVRLYSSKGGQFMRMHPVILMFAMMFCWVLMGTSGMFLSIPLCATVKYYLLCLDLPVEILHPVLVFIEGHEAGAYMNAVDWERAKSATTATRGKAALTTVMQQNPLEAASERLLETQS